MRNEQAILTILRSQVQEAQGSLVMAKQKVKESLQAETGSMFHALDTLHRAIGYEAVVGLSRYCNDNMDASIIQRPGCLIESLTFELANGADDTWSGRANDARRIAFDAKAKAIRTALGI